MSTTEMTLDEQATDAKPGTPVPAKRDPASLYRYSSWLHVGAGAEECTEVDENEGVNTCGDRAHFHAWCRLPNPLQMAEIRQRALAAKARKLRQLRDPESDAFAILEEEFGMLGREGDQAREKVADELVQMDFLRDYYEAMMEVRQIEDPHGESEEDKLYAHIEDDQRRFMRLDAMPEDERPQDEFESLKRHLDAYTEEVNRVTKQRQEPRRSALDGLSTEQLIEQLRDRRVEAEAQREFQNVYEVHEWLSCTYRQRDGAPALADLEVLERAATEVITGLQTVFTDLKRTAQEAPGN